MDSHVEILLSTFNGEKYLEVQMESILQQDYPYWKLLVRDDGSTDGTLLLLNQYIQKYPDKIKIIEDGEGNIGYARSFMKLVKESSADYVMYCDQDDYWYPSKISTMLSVILEEETKLPAKAHIVFSDLEIVNEDMNVISSSFLKKVKYSYNRSRRIFFLKSYNPGCNLLFNRALIKYSENIDNIVNLHDYWLLMICSAVGKITCINKSLMKYRMHDRNAIGIMKKEYTFTGRFLLFMKDVLKFGFANKKYRSLMYWHNIGQMKNICDRLPENVSKDAIEFSKIDKSNYFSRKVNAITKPYTLENSLLEQLTYIICF